MDPLHITEFASERYFSKLRQLNEHPDHHASSATTTTTTTTTTTSSTTTSTTPGTSTTTDHLSTDLPPPLLAPTFTLPLGNPRQRDADLGPIPIRTSDQKKRSLGHDLSSLRTQRRPSFSGSFGSLRSKVSVIHKTPTIVEHYEHILATEQDGLPQAYVPPLSPLTYHT